MHLSNSPSDIEVVELPTYPADVPLQGLRFLSNKPQDPSQEPNQALARVQEVVGGEVFTAGGHIVAVSSRVKRALEKVHPE